MVSRKTLILAVVGLVFGSLYSVAVEAHWCSNIFTAHARIVVKPEKSTIVLSSTPTNLRVYLQNNFPYKITAYMRATSGSYVYPTTPSSGYHTVYPGQNVSYVFSLTGSGSVQVSTLNLQMKFRTTSSTTPSNWTWRNESNSILNQSPTQSTLISSSNYGSNQAASLDSAQLGDDYPSASLGSSAPYFGRTGIQQLIHWFGYPYCYKSGGDWGYFSSQQCPSTSYPGVAWSSTAQFAQNCMRAGVEVSVRKSTLGSDLTNARTAVTNALSNSPSNQHRCMAAVVGGYLFQGASSSTFTTALNGSSMPTSCKNAGRRALDGSNSSTCPSSLSHHERAACAAAEGLRNNNTAVTSILMPNAGDGTTGVSGYNGLYYSYMLRVVQGYRKASTGYVPFYPDAGTSGCSTAGDCDDSNPCTTDSCPSGSCVNTAISGCCTSASQCGDSDPCTADTCVSNACVNTPISSCCTAASQCGDSNICTTDSCVSNACVNTAISNCCTAAGQCNDSNACTTNTCVSNACVFTPISGCCTAAAQCNDNNVCTTDACTSNSCQNTTISGCCTSNNQCNDSNVCTSDTCVSNACQNSTISGCCTAAGQCSDSNACTTDTCVSNACVFTPISGCCSTNANCNDSNPCTTDTCNTTTGICTNANQAGCCAVDTECADTNICTSDKCVSNACQNTAISGCCTAASQCNDSNACTTDTCVSNACQYATVANCCTTNAQCNDNNACTTDTCSANTCSNTAVSGCCTTNTQCDDKNKCTTDACSANKCVYTPTAGCCTTDTDCADNDSCTVDTCDTSSGTCSNIKTSGCCSYDTDCDDSDSCTLDTCDTTTNTCSNANILCGDAGPPDASSSDLNASADAAAGPDTGTGNPADVNSLTGGCSLGGERGSPLPLSLSLLTLLGVWLLRRRRRQR
jgi:Dictyostelium (slime mold) repeat